MPGEFNALDNAAPNPGHSAGRVDLMLCCFNVPGSLRLAIKEDSATLGLPDAVAVESWTGRKVVVLLHNIMETVRFENRRVLAITLCWSSHPLCWQQYHALYFESRLGCGD